MNDSVKLLFDECVGAPIADALGRFLRTLYSEPHEVRHLSEFQKLGTPDETWIPIMSSQGFLAVTSDRGKSGRGKKLPLLCVRYGMSHIILLPSIHRLKSAEKIQAIITLWSQVIEATKSPRGSRFYMSCAGTDSRPTMRMVEITEAEKLLATKYDDGNDAPAETLF